METGCKPSITTITYSDTKKWRWVLIVPFSQIHGAWPQLTYYFSLICLLPPAWKIAPPLYIACISDGVPAEEQTNHQSGNCTRGSSNPLTFWVLNSSSLLLNSSTLQPSLITHHSLHSLQSQCISDQSQSAHSNSHQFKGEFSSTRELRAVCTRKTRA